MHEFDVACLCESCNVRWMAIKDRAAYHSSLDEDCACRACVLVRSSWLRARDGALSIHHDLIDNCACPTCSEVGQIKAKYA